MQKCATAIRQPVERDLAEDKERHAGLAARWSHEKEAPDRVKEITQRIDELRSEYERAERAGDFNRAAEIRHGELPTQNEYDQFVHDITYHTYVHENIKPLIEGFRYDAQPIAMMTADVAARSS